MNRPLVSLARPWPLSLAVLLALPARVPAQTQVRYGDPARTEMISSIAEADRYLLIGGQQGDRLRITFSSQNSGYPSYYYFHQLEVRQGVTPVAPPIQGVGLLDVTLPNTGFYTIEVRARNSQSTGWYAFQLDRMNDPVGADRIAFNWGMRGTIQSAAAFAVRTLRAEAGSTGNLNFTCQNTGYPSYYYIHYAELLDPTGQSVANVQGQGSAVVNFQTTGIYTLFVAARNYESTGWYAGPVECQSWPVTPCDTIAHASNHGEGWPVTGAPALTASAPPRFGTTIGITVGNPFALPTVAVLLIGIDTEALALPGGGTLLVAPSADLWFVPLPAGGAVLNVGIPTSPLLLGFGITMQSALADPVQPSQLALSRGLGLVLGL
jgi:hypothetical protein